MKRLLPLFLMWATALNSSVAHAIVLSPGESEIRIFDYSSLFPSMAKVEFTLGGLGFVRCGGSDSLIRFFSGSDGSGIEIMSTKVATMSCPPDLGGDGTGGSIVKSKLELLALNETDGLISSVCENNFEQGTFSCSASIEVFDSSGASLGEFEGTVLSRVPEPATVALVGLGLAAFGLSRRKRT
jgi:hypothetical protein